MPENKKVQLQGYDGANFRDLEVESAANPNLKISIFSGSLQAGIFSTQQDAQTNNVDNLAVGCYLYAFNGSTWDRLGVESSSINSLKVAIFGVGGAIISGLDNADGVSDGNRALLMLSRLSGFNGTTWDRIRTLGDTALLGLGQLSVSPAIPGASTVKGAREVINNTSTSSSAAAPASGKQLRIISVQMNWNDATAIKGEIFFHATGAGTSADDETKIIAEAVLDLTDSPNFVQTWPDGGGPIGAVDDDITVRVASAVATDCVFIIHYREE